MTDAVATLQGDALFDAAWYLARHPDVAATGLAPAAHYLAIGAELGRDPGPHFSTRWYLAAHPDVAAAGINPLLHFVQPGRAEGRAIAPAGTSAPVRAAPGRGGDDAAPLTMAGALPRRAGAPLVLVVGHAAGPHWFGAERSLLTLLESYQRIGIDTAVGLPLGADRGYVAEVARRTTSVHTIPVPPRRPQRSPDPAAVAAAAALIANTGAHAVQTNTIVPREALVAARSTGVPAVVYAREIPHDDPQLQEWLDADAGTIVASVAGEADHLLAPSQAAAGTYGMTGRSAVVPPVVDERLLTLPLPDHDGPLRLALIGSVQEKKGTADFVALATLLAERTDVRCQVIGPLTPYAHRLLHEGVPGNFAFAGPAADPVAALTDADVVVNLSTCHEAFGRTMLEAMAAGRPAVAWNRGGLAEVITDDVSGYLVPYRDLAGMAHRIRWLRDPAVRRAMGVAGRARAITHFSADAGDRALAAAWAAILPRAGEESPAAAGSPT